MDKELLSCQHSDVMGGRPLVMVQSLWGLVPTFASGVMCLSFWSVVCKHAGIVAKDE